MRTLSKVFFCGRANAAAIFGNAVAWAVLIVVLAQAGFTINGNRMTLTGCLIAGWFATHTLLHRQSFSAR